MCPVSSIRLDASVIGVSSCMVLTGPLIISPAVTIGPTFCSRRRRSACLALSNVWSLIVADPAFAWPPPFSPERMSSTSTCCNLEMPTTTTRRRISTRAKRTPRFSSSTSLLVMSDAPLTYSSVLAVAMFMSTPRIRRCSIPASNLVISSCWGGVNCCTRK